MKKLLFSLAFILIPSLVLAQGNPAPNGTTTAQAVTALYGLTAISATATGGTVTTLTIPAPTTSGFYNYICYLALNASEDNVTPTVALTNVVTSSTNFNSQALKFSKVAGLNTTYDWNAPWGSPGLGCAKSASPTTATTFVSPSTADTHYTWYATYYQAP